ncbi:MAG: carboxypeptidase-like regulatory domain-containing protein, partial [Bacteroidales bacterium]|nr:carboxypeptidase-like regulatory domain-containing protein [Bacteroidales bacterium]
MKKKIPFMVLRPPGGRLKTLLTIIMMVSTMLSVSASSYSQYERMNINLKNASLSTLIEEIRQQSDYSFFFNEDNVAQLENLNLRKSNATIEEILTEVLDNTGLTFSIIEDVIIIKMQDEAAGLDQDTKVSIKGKVTDGKTGESLPGVNVVVKNSVLGTVTNMNGEYEITLPDSKEALIFSFIGYEIKEVPIEGKTTINVMLDEQMHELGDVVVTGYEVISKHEMTSSIVKIDAEELTMKNALTVDQMLEGKVTGLMVTNISATPGAAAKVRIRGGNTFTGNQSPLWVIDGIIYEDPVPLSPDEINSFDQVNVIGNALTGLNP